MNLDYSFRPINFQFGNIVIVFSAMIICACGGGLSSEPAAPITPPTNNAPTIAGSPPTSIVAGQAYTFTPTASDLDNDTLTFTIANLPSWATFDATSGSLTGTPSSNDVGSYSAVSISVSDGQATVSLPAFSIGVDPLSPTNNAPTIAGSPPTSIVAGQAYAFTPTASDPDNDTLTFTIANRPSWATFDATSGSLSGTPLPNDVGPYSAVSISVGDGQATVSLPAFSIGVDPLPAGSVVITWDKPTLSADGSMLDDLRGYRVRWGTQTSNYPDMIDVNDSTAEIFTVSNLASANYFFVVTAIDTSGNESLFSNETTISVP